MDTIRIPRDVAEQYLRRHPVGGAAGTEVRALRESIELALLVQKPGPVPVVAHDAPRTVTPAIVEPPHPLVSTARVAVFLDHDGKPVVFIGGREHTNDLVKFSLDLGPGRCVEAKAEFSFFPRSR